MAQQDLISHSYWVLLFRAASAGTKSRILVLFKGLLLTILLWLLRTSISRELGQDRQKCSYIEYQSFKSCLTVQMVLYSKSVIKTSHFFFRSDLASEFLPDICGVFMSHLFQRCLFEYHDYNLELIEKAWNNICDHCPLAALLTGMFRSFDLHLHHYFNL